MNEAQREMTIDEIWSNMIMTKIHAGHSAVKEFLKLKEDARFLEALRAVGVDNWEGYEYACDLIEEWNKKAEETQDASS